MSSLQHARPGASPNPFARLDRMFDEWFRTLPVRRPEGDLGGEPAEGVIRVDEYRDGDTQVIRAEMAGIDPERDVEISVQDGILRIAAERRVEEDRSEQGWTRHELRYGSFARSLPLPDGATAGDITATYRDGILEIRVPVAEPEAAEPTRIPVSKG